MDLQDFSKEGLIFQLKCSSETDKRVQIIFFKPNKLANTPISNYVLDTEIHYDVDFYLIVMSDDVPKCKYKCQIFKRKN